MRSRRDAIVLMQPTIPQMSTPAGEQTIDAQISYDERGLVPCVIQDWRSGEVLTMAYMNEQALKRTRATGELHLWSRSRDELWKQGRNERQHPDGEGAAVGLRRRHAARAGGTGGSGLPHGRADLLSPRRARAARALRDSAGPGADADARAKERPAGSYTVELLDDPRRIGEKVQEEAEEVARAAREESDERVDEEAADVIYHLLVLLHSRGRALADAERVLDERRS